MIQNETEYNPMSAPEGEEETAAGRSEDEVVDEVAEDEEVTADEEVAEDVEAEEEIPEDDAVEAE